jgi:nucleoid-associated protein YgaU
MPKATYQTVPVPQSGRVPEKQFSPQSIVYTQTKEKGKETGKETEKEPIHEGNTITDRVTNTLGSGAPFGYPPKVGGNAPTGGNVVPPPPPDNYRPPVGGIGVSPTSVTPPPPPKTLPPPTPPTGGRPPSQGWNTQLINKQRYIQSATERDFLDAINLSRTLARTQREAEIAKRTRALERYDENQQKVDDIHKEFRTVIQAEKRKKIEEDIKQGWNNFKEGWNEFWTDIGEGVVDGWNWLTTTTSKGLKAFISLCFSSAGDAEAKKPIDKQRIIALERYEENQRTIDNIHNEFTELMKEHKRRKAYEDGLMSDTYDYTIVSGDTYNGILSAFGVDGGNRGLIASLNKIENLDKIFAGQVLKIPKSFITKYPSTGTEGTETGNGGEEETPPETGGEFTTEELSKGWKYVAGGSVLSKLLGRDSTLSKILKKEYTMPSAQSVASSQAALKQELVNKTKGKIPTPKIDELLSVVLDSTLTKSANSALSALRTLDEVAQVLGDTLDTTIPGTNINFGQTLLFLGSVIGAGLMLLQGNTSGVSNLFK